MLTKLEPDGSFSFNSFIVELSLKDLPSPYWLPVYRRFIEADAYNVVSVLDSDPIVRT